MRRLRSTFSSLGSYNFRLFFTVQAISLTGTWMQKVGQIWLVLELSDSGTLLGLTAALQHVPTILVGPWGGLLADRVSKRKMLVWTQAASGIVALTLGVLVAVGQARLWMILLLAFALGTINSLERPARNTFVLELVGPSQLTNAVTLNNVVMNIGKVVGPAFAGIAIATLGLSSSFFINAASYVVVVVGILMMRATDISAARPVDRGPGQLTEAFTYVRGNPELFTVVLMAGAIGLFAWEWNVTLPMLAHETFRGGAETLGWMFSSLGAGAVVGGLLISGSARASIRSVFVVAFLFGLSVLIASVAPTVSAALVMIFVVGGTGIGVRAITASYVQLVSSQEMQGRVMALLIIAFQGTTTIGGPLLGFVGDSFGARTILAIGGVATLTAVLVGRANLHRQQQANSPMIIFESTHPRD